jgi:hypothetical protein
MCRRHDLQCRSCLWNFAKLPSLLEVPSPCKSHDHATNLELSWDYRGICQASKNESAVPLAPQT